MISEDLLPFLIWSSVLLICLILALVTGELYRRKLRLAYARLEQKRKLLFCLPLLLLAFWYVKCGVDAVLWCCQDRGANCTPFACHQMGPIPTVDYGFLPTIQPHELKFYALSFALLALLLLLTRHILRQHLTLDRQRQEIACLHASQETGNRQVPDQV